MNEELLRKEIAKSILPSGLKAYLLFELKKMTVEQKQKIAELLSDRDAENKNS
jgi:predicted nuclease with TOPRIM domain